MSTSLSAPTSSFYYAGRPGFDYRRYLEEKSHFDSVVLAVDDASLKSVGGMTRLQNRMGTALTALERGNAEIGNRIDAGFDRLTDRVDAGFTKVDDTLQRGFGAVSLHLEEINDSIGNMAFVCEQGFGMLAAESARSNVLLQEIASLMKTPDQVWAQEQFQAARGCMDRELWAEALKMIDRAIDGDGHRSGYFVEPAFHFLRGDILMNMPERSQGMAFVREAADSFLEAHKLGGKKPGPLQAMALVRASWCRYVDEKRDEAIVLVRRAISIDPTAVAWFHLAKYTAETAVRGVHKPLVETILKDEIFLLRAKNDVSFAEVDVDASVEEAQQRRRAEFDKWRKDEFDEAGTREMITILSTMTSEDSLNVFSGSGESEVLAALNILKTTVAEIEGIAADGSIAALNDFMTRSPEGTHVIRKDATVRRTHFAVVSNIKAIGNRFAESESNRVQKKKIVPNSVSLDSSKGGAEGAVLGAIIGSGATLIFQLLVYGRSYIEFCGLFAIVGGVLLRDIMQQQVFKYRWKSEEKLKMQKAHVAQLAEDARFSDNTKKEKSRISKVLALKSQFERLRGVAGFDRDDEEREAGIFRRGKGCAACDGNGVRWSFDNRWTGRFGACRECLSATPAGS